MSQPANVDQARPSIAILDSDPELREAVSAFLSLEGYRVTQANTFGELADHVRAGSVGLVIVAGSFVEPGREEALASLREIEGAGGLPLIALTTRPSPSGPLRRAADFVLTRPIQMGQLREAMALLRTASGFARRTERSGTQPGALHQPSRFPRTGTLTGTAFANLFADVWRHGLTGAVNLRSGSTWRRVDFRNGYPIAAHSNLVTEHLLRYLLRIGYIGPEVYRELLPRAQGNDWRAGSTLVTEGVIEEPRLEEARRRLAHEIVLQCFRWDGAAYRLADLESGVEALVVLNPFEVYASWLREPAENDRLQSRFAELAGRAIVATPALREHTYWLRTTLEPLPKISIVFDGTRTAANLAELLGDTPEARARVVCLVALGVLRPVSLTPVSTRVPAQPRGTPEGRKLKRIRQMVEEDRGRVARSATPYAILGLPKGASSAEVRASYLRFCRFYRPENFERLGDAALLEAARSLLDAFNEAARSILGETPEGLGERRATPDEEAPAPEEAVLAEVFFDDGSTYLRLGDYAEAYEHFQRADELVPKTSKYLAHTGWCTYRLGANDPLRVKNAKEMLLSALKLDKRNDRALYFLGCLYEDAGRVERAIDCWKRALRINSTNYDARSALRRASA